MSGSAYVTSSGLHDNLNSICSAPETRNMPQNSEVQVDTPRGGFASILTAKVDGTNMVKPANFGRIDAGMYRSNFPQAENLGFLAGLGLKTIVTLVKKDELNDNFVQFIKAHDIRHIVIDMAGTKKKAIDATLMDHIIDVVSDKANQPVLLHCNHGKHRTGCVVGTYRRKNGWDTESIIAEYRRYAGEKARECDIAYLSDEPFVPSPESESSITSGSSVASQLAAS